MIALLNANVLVALSDALAAEHGGRLITFDRNIPIDAVPAAKSDHLEVL